MRRIVIDRYVVETLMCDLVGHDRKPSAFIIYLLLWNKAQGTRGKGVAISHQQIADETGVSKSSVQSAVRHLLKRKLLRNHKRAATAVPEYFVLRPWSRGTGR